MNTADALDFLEVAADNDIDTLLAQLLTDSEEKYEAPQHEGSLVGRAASIERGSERHKDQLLKEFFSKAPIYCRHMFERPCRENKK